MSSAVVDLQRAIASGNKPLSQLLRETKLIAAKLNLTDMEQWVDYELSGYPTDVRVPEYRKCRSSHLELRNPVRGWDHAGVLDRMVDVRQPITVIEDLAKAPFVSVTPPKLYAIQDSIGAKWPQRIVIPTIQIQRIVDAIRNELLKWSIELERRGIRGENMSFDETEKQSATHQVFNIQKFSGVFGNVTNSQVTLYDYSSLHQMLKEQNVPQNERNELENIMDSLKTAEPDQKKSLLQQGKAWIVKNKEFLGASMEIVTKAIGASQQQ